MTLRYKESMEYIHSHVLVLGAGLAGLRAAWAAKEHDPQLDVLLATACSGPSGSSFANRNNALGMQFLCEEAEQEIFVQEALTLGAPGYVDSKLVRLMARECEPRFKELCELKLEFRRDDGGGLRRFTGCGSPHKRAAIFDNLPHAFNQFTARTTGYGIDQLIGFIVLGLIVEDGICMGAWGVDSEGDPLVIHSRAVVLAIGGPAPLYRHRVCGPANPGFSLGLLHDAGAVLANESFLQFMWYDSRGNFRNLNQVLGGGASIVRPGGSMLAPGIREDLLHARGTHCPAFYGHEDALADEMLLSHRWDDGWCRVKQGGETVMLTLMAHAGNGGAVVDELGETSIRNLFAAGECATGMHGANRMGGGMVLATQVFGQRAGLAAARRAADQNGQRPDTPRSIPADAFDTHVDQYHIDMEIIRSGMHRHALFSIRPGIDTFINELVEIIESSDDRRTALSARTALAVCEHALTFRK